MKKINPLDKYQLNFLQENNSIYSNYLYQHILLPRILNNSKTYAPNIFYKFLHIFVFLNSSIQGFIYFLYFFLHSFFKSYCIQKYDFTLNKRKLFISTCKTSNKKLLRVINLTKNNIIFTIHSDLYYSIKSVRFINVVVYVFKFYKVDIFIYIKYFYILSRNILSYFRIISNIHSDLFFSSYVGKRIYLDSLNETVIFKLLNSNKVNTVYSGCTNERYAIFLQNICTKLNITTKTIPHGISPNLNLPAGLFGNHYLCLSKSEYSSLKSIFPMINFYFREKHARYLYKINDSSYKPKNICIATTSRSFKIDQSLIDNVSSYVANPLIKFHPNDSYKNYNIPSNCLICNSYEYIINNCIIVTSLSAITLDVAYNGGIAYVYIAENDIYYSQNVYAGLFHEKSIIITDFKQLRFNLLQYQL